MGLFEDLLRSLENLRKLYEQKQTTRREKGFREDDHSVYYYRKVLSYYIS
jgi:esterase/lipase superfamily enzyme